MHKDFIIGIDTGTSVVKAVLADLQGVELASATENTPVENPYENWSEYDLVTDWNRVVRAIRKLLSKTRIDPGDILAIAVTGKGWGCCYLDEKLRPVRKGILWNDSRSGYLIQQWATDGILSECFKISGNYYYTGDCGPITRWLIEHEPETVKRVRAVIFPPAWIARQLTDHAGLIYGDASSLFDMRNRSYSERIFELLGISQMRDRFPTPTLCTEPIGEVARNAANQTGLKAGTPVVLAEVDVSSCATGVGVIEPGDVCIILGTAHIVSIGLDEPIFEPEAGLQMTYVDGKFLKLVPPVIATPNVDWFLSNFGASDFQEARRAKKEIFAHLDEKLKIIPPGAEGIIYHPYLSPIGERCPFTKLTAKGNFFGLGLHHSRHHLLRSIYEGVAFAAHDCLTASKVNIRRIMLSGGGAKSDVWAGIEADVLGKTVRVPVGQEFGAKGAVLTAMVAMGLFPDHQSAIKQTIKAARVFEPDAANHELYRGFFELYRNIVSHLWSDWDKRSEVLEKTKRL